MKRRMATKKIARKHRKQHRRRSTFRKIRRGGIFNPYTNKEQENIPPPNPYAHMTDDEIRNYMRYQQ